MGILVKTRHFRNQNSYFFSKFRKKTLIISELQYLPIALGQKNRKVTHRSISNKRTCKLKSSPLRLGTVFIWGSLYEKNPFRLVDSASHSHDWL